MSKSIPGVLNIKCTGSYKSCLLLEVGHREVCPRVEGIPFGAALLRLLEVHRPFEGDPAKLRFSLKASFTKIRFIPEGRVAKVRSSLKVSFAKIRFLPAGRLTEVRFPFEGSLGKVRFSIEDGFTKVRFGF